MNLKFELKLTNLSLLKAGLIIILSAKVYKIGYEQSAKDIKKLLNEDYKSKDEVNKENNVRYSDFAAKGEVK